MPHGDCPGPPPRRSSRRPALSRAARWLVLVCCVALPGCTDVIGGAPRAATGGPAHAGPIFPSQLEDLLTPSGTLTVVPNSPLTEVDMAVTGADGTKAAIKGKPGDAIFGRPARHREENMLDQPVELILVEFKGKG